jgi:putative transcriptional regulator
MAQKSKIIAGLEEAVKYARGDVSKGTSRTVFVSKPLDVRAIRQRQGLTQEAFAKKFGFSLSTIKNWEQGHRAPTGPSLTLLLVIDKRPLAVEEALAAVA